MLQVCWEAGRTQNVACELRVSHGSGSCLRFVRFLASTELHSMFICMKTLYFIVRILLMCNSKMSNSETEPCFLRQYNFYTLFVYIVHVNSCYYCLFVLLLCLLFILTVCNNYIFILSYKWTAPTLANKVAGLLRVQRLRDVTCEQVDLVINGHPGLPPEPKLHQLLYVQFDSFFLI